MITSNPRMIFDTSTDTIAVGLVTKALIGLSKNNVIFGIRAMGKTA